MRIKVIVSGCNTCSILERVTREAAEKADVEATVERVTDPEEIASFGLLGTPGLAVDGHVVVKGRVPTVDDLAELLRSLAR